MITHAYMEDKYSQPAQIQFSLQSLTNMYTKYMAIYANSSMVKHNTSIQ